VPFGLMGGVDTLRIAELALVFQDNAGSAAAGTEVKFRSVIP